MVDMDQDVLAEIIALEAAEDYQNPRYMELLLEHHYVDHILRKPLEEWPDAIMRIFAHANQDVYVPMQGPSELGASGALIDWDRKDDLHNINVPTLVIGATHDTMDPEHMRAMSEAMPNGRFLLCPNGSHLAQWDDEEIYFKGLIEFIKDVDSGN